MDSIICLVIALLMIRGSTSLRILALHGSGSHGARFSAQTSKFQEELGKLSLQPEYTFLDGPFIKEAGLSWWSMRDGERSSNAKELIGLDVSLGLIEESASYDIIMGHSQGAMMAAIALSRSLLRLGNPQQKTPKLAILSGSSYPEAMKDLFISSSSCLNGLRSVHAIGSDDKVNPPELAHRLASSFNAEVIEHDGGHIFPQDDASLAVMMRAIEDVFLSQ